ncbi:MAG TPA: site-specific integrase [Thermomicrobiales bacterium]|nr:site-specific integrase [Thermomicrobiales bacterium]
MPTRRGHHEGTIRQRPDGTWEVRLSLAGGRRKSLYAKTRREVQDKLRATQRDLDVGVDVGARQQTVGQFLTRWLEDTARPTIRPSTYASYAGHVHHHLIPALGHYPLAKLTPQHVQKLLNDKQQAGLSPRTVAYMRAVLRRALGYAVKWSLVSRNVATLVDPPRAVQKPVQPLSAAQVRILLDATKDDRLGPLIHVAIATGLRQGELFGLRWRDTDLDTGTLHVRYAMQRIDGVPTFVEPKTALSRRTIPLPPSAVAALRTQRLRQIEDRLLAGSRWQDWDLVFASGIGTPLDSRNVTTRFQRLLSKVGLPRQRFHDLRHCAASLLLAGGVPPRTIMGLLGHSQISLTMNTYAHLSPALERDAADRMETFLAKSS